MSILKMRNEEIESSYSSSKIESNWLSEIPMPKLNIGDYSSLSSEISTTQIVNGRIIILTKVAKEGINYSKRKGRNLQ